MLLLAAPPSTAAAENLRGTWMAVFTGPFAERPKMAGEMIFVLDTAGDTLLGEAHMAAWPGDAPIRGGRVDGRRFSVTAIG